MERWWELVVDDVTMTANPFLRTHWAKRKRIVEGWYYLLVEAGAQAIPPASAKRHVRVERYSTGTPDYANLWTPIDKCILDNLVKLEVLKNDSPLWLHPPTVVPVKAKKKDRKTVIIVWEDNTA